MNDRTCPQCGRRFFPNAPHQIYDVQECRQQGWVERQIEAVQAGAQRVEPTVRRKSKDGRGTRVYLTFGEIVHLEQARARLELPFTPAGQQLEEKLQRALERIPYEQRVA